MGRGRAVGTVVVPNGLIKSVCPLDDVVDSTVALFSSLVTSSTFLWGNPSDVIVRSFCSGFFVFLVY